MDRALSRIVNSAVKKALDAHRKFGFWNMPKPLVMYEKPVVNWECLSLRFMNGRTFTKEKARPGYLEQTDCQSHPRKIPTEYVEKILHFRKEYNFGPQRITWYLERYYGFNTSSSTVYRTLKRNGAERLPRNAPRRAIHTRRCAKQVRGHHIQVDVKFLSMKTKDGRKIRRYQYTAIDDATRIRALKIYSRHNQASSMSFIDYVIEKFPFRIHTIRTDRGHEWQAQFHWHTEDRGMRHVSIKPRSPQHNGKVERSHRSDQEEFCQLLDDKDDVDLDATLAEGESFYNFNRLHGAHKGKSPYEALRRMLK